jgi:hypothetical protein
MFRKWLHVFAFVAFVFMLNMFVLVVLVLNSAKVLHVLFFSYD